MFCADVMWQKAKGCVGIYCTCSLRVYGSGMCEMADLEKKVV